MPVRSLPSKPSLTHLKHQAKDLLKAHSSRNAEAAQRLREFHPRFKQAANTAIFEAQLKLSDAQLAIAREYGFASWARLKKHIEEPKLRERLKRPHHERIEDATFRRAVDLVDAGDAVGLRAYLKQHPHLVHQHIVFEGGNYFRDPTLLEFIAENPVRHRAMPPNVVQVAKAILEADPDQDSKNQALMLVATGRVARESRVQIQLIELLCGYGAVPASAIHPAALHGEISAVKGLLECGARIDLPVAAALGRTEDARKMLSSASPEDRHLALTLAADLGHAEVVRLLLDAGEDPNRYNPVGGHSHTTPLHQAAGAGHMEIVKLLVEHGARLDMKDILWQATPADWARHAGKTSVEAYLRAQKV